MFFLKLLNKYDKSRPHAQKWISFKAQKNKKQQQQKTTKKQKQMSKNLKQCKKGIIQ